MKKLIAVLLFALVPALASAQAPPPYKSAIVTHTTGAPSFTCSAWERFHWNSTTNVLSFCENGVWISVLGAASTSFPLLAPAGSVTAPSYGFDSGFADMGMWRSTTNLLLQNKDTTPTAVGRSRLTLGEENFSLNATRTEDAAHTGQVQCYDEGGTQMFCRFDMVDGFGVGTFKLSSLGGTYTTTASSNSFTVTNPTVTSGSCALCVGGDPQAMGWGRRTSPSANRVMAMVVNGSDFAYFDAFNAGSWEANWTNVNFFTFRNGGTVSAPGVRWGSSGQGFSSSNEELIYVSPGGVKEVGFSESGLNFEFVTVTVADNAVGASPAAATLTVSNNLVKLVCNDADGCDITMSENFAGAGTFGLAPGRQVYIVNTSANVCNFADTAGVSELAGAFAMGQYDSLTLVHFGAGSPQTWVEVARSNN